MIKKYSFLLITFLFLSSSMLYGQKQIWEIYTIEDQPYVGVVLDKISNDTLYIKTTGNKYEIPLESIKILKRKRKSKAGIGTLTGMLIGGLTMNLYSRKKSEDQTKFPIDLSDLSITMNTGLGIFGGGIIGYWIGTGLGTDEYYDFSKISYKKKKKILEHLLSRKP